MLRYCMAIITLIIVSMLNVAQAQVDTTQPPSQPDRLKQVEKRLNQLSKRIDAIEKQIQLLTKQKPAPPARLVTDVIAVKFADASALSQIIQGVYAGIPIQLKTDVRSNSIIIRSDGKTIAQLRSLIELLDQPVQEKPKDNNGNLVQLKIFSLQHADAQSMVAVLQGLFSDPSRTLVADVRTNSVLVKAKIKDLKIIEAVIMKLDVAVEQLRGKKGK